MTAFWCSRLTRKAASSRSSTNSRASRAESSMSSSSPASRIGRSAIDCLSLLQNGAAANVIAAFLDRGPLHKIDRAPQQIFESLFEVEIGRDAARGRVELDQEIRVAPCRIEVVAAGSRAEYFEPRDAMTAAQRAQLPAPSFDFGVHRQTSRPGLVSRAAFRRN